MSTTIGKRIEYRIGVMMVAVEERDPIFRAVVDRAVSRVEEVLRGGGLHLRIELCEFRGPHLSPSAGAYSPLDFLQMGLAEHVDRRLHFLLVVTEVDLSATGKPYVLALSSQLTNVGILSTKRLAPSLRGEAQREEVAGRRLAGLALHVLGHILNLGHHPEPSNVMYDLSAAEDLDRMTDLTPEQLDTMRSNLPREAREEMTKHHRWRFAARTIVENRASIWRAMVRANPFRLVLRLPAMIAAGLSVAIVLFFSTEIWDVASTVESYQLVLFALISLLAATVVLYRAFAIGSISTRDGALTESSVVTEATTGLSLFATLLVLYLGFFILTFLGAVTIFPVRLMESWPTVDPATRTLDHVKLGIFLAAMGVLTGSLGGRAEGKDLIRHVLFFGEET